MTVSEVVYKSGDPCDIPSLDLLSLLFDSEYCIATEDTHLHAEAADPSAVITKAGARKLTKQIAYFLRSEYNIGSNGPGQDVVVTFTTGQSLLPVLFYGIIAAEGVYASATFSLSAADLATQIKDGPGKVLVCSPDTKSVAIEAAKLSGLLPHRILVLESYPTWKLESLDSSIRCTFDRELSWRKITDSSELKKSLACLLYTSGTTGTAKGVMISHRNMVAGAALPAAVGRRAERDGMVEAHPIRTLAHLPPAHVSGMQGYYINPFYGGGVVYWMPKFDFSLFLKYNKELRITVFHSAPIIWRLIATNSLVTDQFDNLRTAYCGGLPLSTEVQQAASVKLGFGKTVISQVWGMTETSGAVTFMPPGQNDTTGSISQLLPNISMRLVNQKGVDVKPGQQGEALLKGPTISNGYHNGPKVTSKTWNDGWFHTGDILQSRENKLYFIDRKTDMIMYLGLQVSPFELETLLRSHPLISDAAVVSVNSVEGEVPRAYIVADASKLSQREVTTFINERVPSYKQLRGGIVYVEAIPTSVTGKVLKAELRALS